MPNDLWQAVDGFIEQRLIGADKALQNATQSAVVAGLPNISVSATQGKLLFLLAQMCQARSILELGTLAGYSAIWLARALAPGGRLVTIEFDPKHAQIAADNFRRAGLSDRIDLRIGAALEVLPKLASERAGPFDLFFIDADKSNTAEYFDWSLRLARPGSVIIVDNVIRKGAILDPKCADSDVIGIRRLYDRLAAEPRVEATAIQTVGVKGWDGLAIARVK